MRKLRESLLLILVLLLGTAELAGARTVLLRRTDGAIEISVAGKRVSIPWGHRVGSSPVGGAGTPVPEPVIEGRGEILWSRHHDGANYSPGAAISEATGRVLAATNGDPTQAEMIYVEGSDGAEWLFPGTNFYAVAAASNADVYAALDWDETTNTVTIYKWHASSKVPDWSHQIPGVIPGPFALAVSDNGARIAVLVQQEEPTEVAIVYIFDAPAGSYCTYSTPSDYLGFRVAISPNGDEVAFSSMRTTDAYGVICALDAASCEEDWWTGALFVMYGLGGICFSPDLSYMAYDEFEFLLERGVLRTRRWFLGNYVPWAAHDQFGYVVTSLACSQDFGTAVTGWISLSDPPGSTKIKLFDLPSCDHLWTATLPPEDAVVSTDITDNGGYAAVGLDTSTPQTPEVMVFERSSQIPICTMDVEQTAVQVNMVCNAGPYIAIADASYGNLWMLHVYEGIVTVPSEYPTIQSAINAVSDGWIIELADGVYTGTENHDLDFGSKAITIRSAGGDPWPCVIDCEGSPSHYAHGVRFRTDEQWNSVLRGVTIKNGLVVLSMPPVRGGAGIRCENGVSPTVHGCILVGNMASPGGGAISCEGASPWVGDCLIYGNRSGSGGGILCTSGAHPTLWQCSLAENVASGDGGGIYCTESAPWATRTTIVRNSATGDGGGLWFHACSAPEVSFCTITENSSGDRGDGIYTESSIVTVAQSNIAFNGWGAWNTGPGAFPAQGVLLRLNWWGDPSGPWHETLNPEGLGDSVSTYVIHFGPWLEEPDATAPVIPPGGFHRYVVSGDSVYCVAWDPVPLVDLAGYRLYYDVEAGPPYASVVDVGNQTNYWFSELSPDTTYYVVVTAYDNTENESWYSEQIEIRNPADDVPPFDVPHLVLQLKPAYPNPFPLCARIQYSVPRKQRLLLSLHDVLGRRLVTLFDGVEQAGHHSHLLDLRRGGLEHLSAGMFLIRLESGGEVQTQKITLVR